MPHLYDGRMLANMLGTPCVGCRATVSKKWSAAAHMLARADHASATLPRPCRGAMRRRPRRRRLDDLVDLLGVLPVAKDAGAALGDAAAAASPSVDAPTLVDAASKTDDVEGLVNEQLHDLHAIVAERDERIAELEARPWARLDAYEDPLTRADHPVCQFCVSQLMFKLHEPVEFTPD